MTIIKTPACPRFLGRKARLGTLSKRVMAAGFLAAILFSACSSGSDPLSRPEELLQQGECLLGDGDYPAAFELALKGKAGWQGRSDSRWYWRFRLLEAEVEYHRSGFQKSLQLLEAQPPPGAAFGELEARRKMLQANAYRRDRKFDTAGRLLEEAEEIASQAGAADLELPIQLRKSLLLLNRGKTGQAEGLMRQVLDQARSRGDLYHQALSLFNLGFSRYLSQRYHEAVSFFDRFLNLTQGQPCLGIPRTLAQSNLAASYAQLGIYENARRIRRRAIERLEGTQDRMNLERAYGLLGNLNYSEGLFREAGEAYRKALKGAQEADILQDKSLWASNLTTTLIALQEWDSAQEANRLSRRYAQSLSPPPTQALLNEARIASGRGDDALAEKSFAQVLEMPNEPQLHWQAYAGLGRLYLRQGSFQKANRNFEQALKIIREQRSRLYDQRSRGSSELDKIAFSSRLIRFYQDYVDALVAQGREADALAAAESSRSLLLQESLQLEGGEEGPGKDSAALQETARRLDAVLLSYWLAPKRSFLWVISPEKIWCIPLPASEKLESRVRSYTELIGRKEDTRSSSWGRQLFEILIQPARRHMGSARRVVIVPDGALHGLNFETLPVPGRPARYWLEDVEVSVAPSLKLLSGDGAAEPGSARLLLFSAPRPVQGFPLLEHARDEAQGILRRFPDATSLSGDDARPEAYRQSHPEQYSFLHFATHAEANRISPLDSAVILSPPPEAPEAFRLHVRDILAVPLPRTRLVTLSACDSAGSRAFAGEGQVGLAWAFLHQGARRVIAGLWKVNDRTSARLMEALYQKIAAGLTPGEALSQAKRELLHQSGRYSVPYYWAPFQLYRR